MEYFVSSLPPKRWKNPIKKGLPIGKSLSDEEEIHQTYAEEEAMHCKNPNKPGCNGQVPATGRAAQYNYCCCCDRKEHGPQTNEEKGVKQIIREMRKGRITTQRAEQLIAALQI